MAKIAPASANNLRRVALVNGLLLVALEDNKVALANKDNNKDNNNNNNKVAMEANNKRPADLDNALRLGVSVNNLQLVDSEANNKRLVDLDNVLRLVALDRRLADLVKNRLPLVALAPLPSLVLGNNNKQLVVLDNVLVGLAL